MALNFTRKPADPNAPTQGAAPEKYRPVWRFFMLMTAVTIPYLFIITAGFAERSVPYSWPSYTNYNSRLTEAFLHGQLSLLLKPGANLLALPDPYDPVAHHKLAPHDLILFDGKFYLYWGPVPALLAAAVCKIIGVTHPTFGDQYLVFALAIATVALTAVLIMRLRAEFFPEIKARTSEVAILSFAVGGPFLFTLARPAVYEVAILAGQAFLLAGILLAWLALRKNNPRWNILLLAGVFLMLSFGSRLSLAPACALVALLAGWRSWQIKRSALPAAAIILPLICGALLLAWYNQARFGKVTEFGMRYQLAYHNQHAEPAGEFSSLRYIPVNLSRYLFTLPRLRNHFPFIFASDKKPAIARLFALPQNFQFEDLIGLVWAQPFLLLGVFGSAWPFFNRDPAHRGHILWLTLTFLVIAIVGILPAFTIEGSTMRYLLDTLPGCTILAALGYWLLLRRQPNLQSRIRIERLAAAVVIGQFMLAIPLGLVGYYDQLARFNPMMSDFFGHLFNRL